MYLYAFSEPIEPVYRAVQERNVANNYVPVAFAQALERVVDHLLGIREGGRRGLTGVATTDACYI
jgi:hypothetical protein